MVIPSFLTARFEQVYIGQSLFLSLPITSGVLQSPVLGPLLFLLYIYISMTFPIVWYHQFKLKYLQVILNCTMLTLLIQSHLCPYQCRILYVVSKLEA